MKRTLLTAALVLSMAGPLAHFSFAQQESAPPPPDAQRDGPGGHRHPPNPHREAEMLSRRLNLTPDQTAKIEPILADRESRIEALRSKTSLDEKGRHEQMRSIRQDSESKMAGVLTPDQLTLLKNMRERRGPGGPGGPGNHGEAPPPPPSL